MDGPCVATAGPHVRERFRVPCNRPFFLWLRFQCDLVGLIGLAEDKGKAAPFAAIRIVRLTVLCGFHGRSNSLYVCHGD